VHRLRAQGESGAEEEAEGKKVRTRYHTYRPEEIALVRERYSVATAAELAELIHGSRRCARSIYNLACRLGLQKWPHIPPPVVRRVRRLHRQGLTDVEIGRRVGLQRRTITTLRARLKLPRNEAAVLEAKRRAVVTQAGRLGLERPGGALRRLAYRKFALANGWPADTKAREVQILNLLAAAGVPLTKRQIAEGIGARTDMIGCNGSLCLLKDQNNSYTGSLVRRGLLIRLPKAFTIHGQGKGRSQDLYALGPVAISILEERACKERTANSSTGC
jgi:hypothetical protein